MAALPAWLLVVPIANRLGLTALVAVKLYQAAVKAKLRWAGAREIPAGNLRSVEN